LTRLPTPANARRPPPSAMATPGRREGLELDLALGAGTTGRDPIGSRPERLLFPRAPGPDGHPRYFPQPNSDCKRDPAEDQLSPMPLRLAKCAFATELKEVPAELDRVRGPEAAGRCDRSASACRPRDPVPLRRRPASSCVACPWAGSFIVGSAARRSPDLEDRTPAARPCVSLVRIPRCLRLLEHEQYPSADLSRDRRRDFLRAA